MSDHLAEWYHRVQLYRAVPPRRLSVFSSPSKPECYVLTVRNAQSSVIKLGVCYRVHVYFYDNLQKYFFGKPYCSKWHRSDANSVSLNEEAFFWCSFHDDVNVVLELVEGQEAGQNSGLFTAAWASFPLANIGPVADYASPNHEMLFRRVDVVSLLVRYPGESTKIELYPALASTAGYICLQTHEKMRGAINYVSAWKIFNQREDILEIGIAKNGILQPTASPELQTEACFLKQITVSFGTDADKFEQALLHLLNNDRLYRANRSPDDVSVKPMEVLERRITIGVHNGLRYVEEPQCLHLIPTENQHTDTLDKNWNNRVMTRSHSDLRPRFRSLRMNGSAMLNGLVANPGVAVVFTLDYLVGVYSQDGTTYASQAVMICWGVWHASAAERKSKDQTIVVPLVGALENLINVGKFQSIHRPPTSTAPPYASTTVQEPGEPTAKTEEIAGPRSKPEKFRENRSEARSLHSIIPDSKRIPRTDDRSERNSIFLYKRSKRKRTEIHRYRKGPDVNIELNDKLNTNETIVQYAAVAFSSEDNGHLMMPTSVFFTMQFYRFQTVTTERLLLHEAPRKVGTHERLHILKRAEGTEKNSKTSCYGFTVKYTVDRHSLPDGEEDDYINYLLSGHLIIDMWDACSLLSLGTTFANSEIQLYLQMYLDITRSRTSSVVSQRLARIGQDEIESYRIKVKPLNPIHENALQRFVTTNRRVSLQGSVKRYLFEQELEAYKKMRNEDKASKLMKAVFKAITTQHRIHPKYGQIAFFEFLLQNTEPTATVIIVDTTNNTLRLSFLHSFNFNTFDPGNFGRTTNTHGKCFAYRPLCDANKWQYYKNVCGVETPLESSLYGVSEENGQIVEVCIFLKPMETIYAPFLYDTFTLPPDQIKNQVKVKVARLIAQTTVFKKKDDGEPIAVLDLLVEVRQNIVKNSFRFYHEAETTLSRVIRITQRKGSELNLSPTPELAYQNLFPGDAHVCAIRCTDPLVILSLRNNPNGCQDLQFTCQTGKAPSLQTFTVIFFADSYYNVALGSWLIHVHAVNRISVNAVRAQLTKVPIVLTVDEDCSLVQFGSLSRKLEISPPHFTGVQRGSTVTASANFSQNIPEDFFEGVRTILICATNQETKRLLNQWMIVANVQEANITKMFDVYLENGKSQTIKLMVGNRYGVERSFRISSSHPEYARIEDELVLIAAYKVTDVCITFLPSNELKLSEVLIFITNVENNLQEEAYSLKLIYSD
ncbi:unnamed protein product [Gongylonema pulchrum]|uniref:DCAF15_WD40 domain-containing protein n=1 Tax=Gongylonema pulchrum TaxID=637853 RepID=A0A183CU98_9BILA|nr:unnamed protein product [Gongylonema pulchrum]